MSNYLDKFAWREIRINKKTGEKFEEGEGLLTLDCYTQLIKKYRTDFARRNGVLTARAVQDAKGICTVSLSIDYRRRNGS